jgi:hypothetical protein
LVARNVQINVLEVVRARPPDADVHVLQGATQVGALGLGVYRKSVGRRIQGNDRVEYNLP